MPIMTPRPVTVCSAAAARSVQVGSAAQLPLHVLRSESDQPAAPTAGHGGDGGPRRPTARLVGRPPAATAARARRPRLAHAAARPAHRRDTQRRLWTPELPRSAARGRTVQRRLSSAGQGSRGGDASNRESGAGQTGRPRGAAVPRDLGPSRQQRRATHR